MKATEIPIGRAWAVLAALGALGGGSRRFRCWNQGFATPM